MQPVTLAVSRWSTADIISEASDYLEDGNDLILSLGRSSNDRVLTVWQALLPELGADVEVTIRHTDLEGTLLAGVEGAAVGAGVGVAAALLMVVNPLVGGLVGLIVGFSAGAALHQVHSVRIYKYRGETRIKLSQN